MVILCTFLDVPGWGGMEGLEIVELFAGVGRIARLGAWLGYSTRAFDLNYIPLKDSNQTKRGKCRRPAMDLNGCAGFVFLVECNVCNLVGLAILIRKWVGVGEKLISKKLLLMVMH